MAEIVASLRETIPGATLRTTVLVGFPGETEAAFETLLEFLDEMRFDRVGSFVYSAEEGTPAASLPASVPAEVAEERARLVQESQDPVAWERQAAMVGSVHEVLIDGPSEDPAFAWEGRTAAQAPEIDGVVYLRDGDLRPGHRVPVEIIEADGYDLVGIVARR
jgi:ribosomal protein S12 methylthiotransferase